jgi:hypothetical protein
VLKNRSEFVLDSFLLINDAIDEGFLFTHR